MTGPSPRNPDVCIHTQEALNQMWLDGNLPAPQTVSAGGDPLAAWLQSLPTPALTDREADDRHGKETQNSLIEHWKSCAVCRQEVTEMLQLDQTLHAGVVGIRDTLEPRSAEGIDATLRRIRGTPQAEFLRHSNRALRLILWVALISLGFIASAGLAVALFHALAG